MVLLYRGTYSAKIAELVGISRMRVIKLLEKAHQAGIVQIKIREDNVRIQSEKHLIEKYGLSDAYVVPTNPNYSETNETIARQLHVHSDRIEDNTFVNIGYGDTLSRVLNNITKQTDKNVSFVSLTGGVNYYLQNMQHSFKNSTLHLILPAIGKYKGNGKRNKKRRFCKRNLKTCKAFINDCIRYRCYG